MSVESSMKKSDLIMDKFSSPENHPLFMGMQLYGFTEKEIHVNDLIKKVQKLRDKLGNLNDESRILKAIGMLVGLGKLNYYKGFIYRP
jgi:hypothetical protein